MEIHEVALTSTGSRSNLNLEVLVFEEEGKTGGPGKKILGARTRTSKKTSPTYDAMTGNRIQATFVGGERSHHCTIPARFVIDWLLCFVIVGIHA